MAQIEAVKTATAAEADADDSQLNPAATAPQRQHMYLSLEFVGVDADMSDIYDMLNTQYGTVQTNKVNTRQNGSFVISA